jgi:hypothetical protein
MFDKVIKICRVSAEEGRVIEINYIQNSQLKEKNQ